MTHETSDLAAQASLLEDVLVRDLGGACAAVSGFVRQDLLRAHYLRAVATHLGLEAGEGEFRKWTGALTRVEQQLDEIRKKIASPGFGAGDCEAVHGDFSSLVNRHRVTARALWTACDFLGLQLESGAVHLERDLRRSLDSTHKLVETYTHLIASSGRLLIGAELLADSTREASSIVSFDYIPRPKVDYNVAVSDGLHHLCVFVELPSWYAVRHRHLPTLAHEIAISWAHAAAENEVGLRCLRKLLQRHIDQIAPVLEQHAEQVGLPAYEIENAAEAYTAKLMADMMAYCVAGPAYLCSLYSLTGLSSRSPRDYTQLPLQVRVASLLRLHEMAFAGPRGGTAWGRVFCDVARVIGARERARPDHRRELEAIAEGFAPLAETVYGQVGHFWSTDPRGVRGQLAEYAWGDIARTYRDMGDRYAPRSSRQTYNPSKWKEFLDETGWRIQSLPNFFWGQFWDQRTSNGGGQKHVPMGRLAFPVWDAVLRPDRQRRPLHRRNYLELRFYRLAPNSSAERLEASLWRSVEKDEMLLERGLFSARVMGSWDLVTIAPDPSQNAFHDFPPVISERHASCRYISEPHVVAELASADEPPWFEKLTGVETLLMTQFVLGARDPTAHFVDRVHELLSGFPGIAAKLILASLGWEDIIVVWGLAPEAEWASVANVIVSLQKDSRGGELARHSFTQVLLTPMFRNAHVSLPPDSHGSGQDLHCKLQVQFTGVKDLSALRSFLSSDVHLRLGEPERYDLLGPVDVTAVWRIETNQYLSDLRAGIADLIERGMATCVDCSWLREET